LLVACASTEWAESGRNRGTTAAKLQRMVMNMVLRIFDLASDICS